MRSDKALYRALYVSLITLALLTYHETHSSEAQQSSETLSKAASYSENLKARWHNVQTCVAGVNGTEAGFCCTLVQNGGCTRCLRRSACLIVEHEARSAQESATQPDDSTEARDKPGG